MGGASWQLAVCKTRCRSDVPLSSTLIAFAASSGWSLAASNGGEVSDNDIHAFKSICGRLADKENAFRSTTER